MNGISIVIISRGRVRLLEELIISVKAAQSETELPTECILVDSSLGDSVQQVKDLSERYGLVYDYRDITVSAKRNHGAEIASYDYVLFLDSDCIATPGILKSYERLLKEHPDAVGACGPLEFVGDDSWIWSVIEKTPYTIFFSTAKWGETFTWAPTANLLVKKNVFEETGGFDETFPKNPGGEDVDFGLRMSKKGKMYCCPDALVYHSKETWCSVKSMFRRVFNYGRGDLALAERHQNMVCTSLPKRPVMILWGILICLILGIFCSPWFFIGCAATPVYEILFTSILVNAVQKRSRSSLIKQILIQLFFIWNECGYLKGCLTQKKLYLRNKQIIHFKPQLDGAVYQYFLSVIVHETYTAILLCLFFAVNL